MSTNYIVIAAFFVISFILGIKSFRDFFSKLRRKRKDITEAIAELTKIKEGEYTLRYEDVNKILVGNSSISIMWHDFSQTLTKAKDTEGNDILFSPIEASEIFRYSTLVKDVNVNYWQNFGGIFTGLGILGTFGGLTLGLENVNLTSSDVAVLKDSIGSLLTGISVAFFTSLFGISFALLYGYLHKVSQEKTVEQINKLAQKIELMYPRKTMEQWLSDGHRESVEQTKAIKNLASEMAGSLSELLDQQLSAGFDELCQNLNEQMKPTFEKLYEAISALNDGGANAIAGAVSEKAGAQLDAFAAALEQMQNLVSAFNQSSEQAMNNMLRTSNAVQESLNESVERNRTQAQGIVDLTQDMIQKQSSLLAESVASNKKQVDETVGLLQETIRKNNETMGESYLVVKDIVQTVEGLLVRLNGTGEVIEKSVVPVVEATQSLKEQLETVKSQTQALHEVTEQQLNRLIKQNDATGKSVQRLSESISDAENKAIDAWNTYHNGLNGIEKEISGVIDHITDTISQYNKVMHEGMIEELKEFDASMSNATGQLKSVIDELSELVEELTGHNRGTR